MVVKSKVGRKRYIIIKIDSDSKITKYDLIFTLNRLLPNSVSDNKDLKFYQMPWVIIVQNNYGIIRCHHLDKNKTIELLQSIEYAGKYKNRVKISTLGTTGTILSARKKYLDKLTLYP